MKATFKTLLALQAAATVMPPTPPPTTSSQIMEDEGHWIATAAQLSGIYEGELREQEQLFLECPAVTVTGRIILLRWQCICHRPGFGRAGMLCHGFFER
jgi:hypothetical protein